MEKIKALAWVIGAVIFTYIVLLGAWVVVSGVVSDTAAQLENRTGIENYTGAVEGVEYAPFVIFLAPAVIGTGAGVYVLKKK